MTDQSFFILHESTLVEHHESTKTSILATGSTSAVIVDAHHFTKEAKIFQPAVCVQLGFHHRRKASASL
jgi:hypothetical protein